MCGGIEYQGTKVFFPNLEARLPVLSKTGNVTWVPWGYRGGDRMPKFPNGGWARLESIKSGKWITWHPRPGLIACNRFIDKDAEGRFAQGRILTVISHMPYLVMFFLAILPTSIFADEYFGEAIKMARSVQYSIKQYDEPGCRVDKNISQEAEPIINEIEKMGLKQTTPISPDNIPDLSVLLSAETTAFKLAESEITVCAMVIRIQAIHSMVGQLRYWESPEIIRAVTYQKTSYAAVMPSKINDALSSMALKMLSRFGFDYYSINKGVNTETMSDEYIRDMINKSTTRNTE